MARVLTDAAVRKFKPNGRRRWIRDAGALSRSWVIQASGHKSWAMRFRRPDGKPAKITLGSVDLSGRELTGEPDRFGSAVDVGRRQAVCRQHPPRPRPQGQDVIADHKARRHRQRSELGDRAESTFVAWCAGSSMNMHR